MWQPLEVVTPPVIEPVGLDEVKEFLRLDTDDPGFDLQLTGFILAAREQLEQITGLAIARQTVRVAIDGFAELLRLPIGPVRGVDAVTYRDRSGATVPVVPARYELFGVSPVQGVRVAFGQSWPNDVAALPDAVSVTLQVGYETVPQPLVVAMLLMVGDMFAFRETVAVGTIASQIPSSHQIDTLIANYRRWS